MAERQYTRKNVFLLLAGRTVSKFGAAFYLIALPLYILQLTGDLARTGLFFSLSSLPALLATPFLGVFVDKVNRKYLLVVCDLLTAALYALLLLPLGAEVFMPVLFGATVLINVLANAFEIGYICPNRMQGSVCNRNLLESFQKHNGNGILKLTHTFY